MTWREYQEKIIRYDQSPRSLSYYTLGLTGEAGEIAEKVKKELRSPSIPVTRQAMQAELGDVLWYLTALATHFGIKLEDVAIENIKKLEGRRLRGTLQGSGDER